MPPSQSRKQRNSQEQGPESGNIHPAVSIPVSQPVGHHVLVHAHAPLGTLAHAPVPARVPCTVEETVPNTTDNSIFQHEEEPTVVAEEGDPEELAPPRSIRLDHCYNRCQRGRLGGTDGQQGGSCLYTMPGRNPQQRLAEVGKAHNVLGRESRSDSKGGLSPWEAESTGRPSLSNISGPQ